MNYDCNFKVGVKASDSFTSPNAMASNGSITSDSVVFATVKTCEELLARLQPIRVALTEPTWEEVIKAAFDKGTSNHQRSLNKATKSRI